jgi:hypothetical protein
MHLGGLWWWPDDGEPCPSAESLQVVGDDVLDGVQRGLVAGLHAQGEGAIAGAHGAPSPRLDGQHTAVCGVFAVYLHLTVG